MYNVPLAIDSPFRRRLGGYVVLPVGCPHTCTRHVAPRCILLGVLHILGFTLLRYIFLLVPHHPGEDMSGYSVWSFCCFVPFSRLAPLFFLVLETMSLLSSLPLFLLLHLVALGGSRCFSFGRQNICSHSDVFVLCLVFQMGLVFCSYILVPFAV